MGKQTANPISRSIYPRNAKAKSGYMTDPSKNATSRQNLKASSKFNKHRKFGSSVVTDVMLTLDREEVRSIDNSDETRFTLPNSPNNVNVVVEAARRSSNAHNEVIKTLKAKSGIKRVSSSGVMDVVE
jgi:hypothetical protein